MAKNWPEVLLKKIIAKRKDIYFGTGPVQINDDINCGVWVLYALNYLRNHANEKDVPTSLMIERGIKHFNEIRIEGFKKIFLA